jgi:hypothetical protein
MGLEVVTNSRWTWHEVDADCFAVWEISRDTAYPGRAVMILPLNDKGKHLPIAVATSQVKDGLLAWDVASQEPRQGRRVFPNDVG